MSKVLFAGSRTDCVTLLFGTLNEAQEVSGPPCVDLTFVDAGIQTSHGGAQGFLTDPASAPLLEPYAVPVDHSFYFHTAFAYNDGFGYYGVYQWLQFRDSAGYPWVQVLTNGQVQFNGGTGPAPSWVNLGGSVGTPGGLHTCVDFDIKVDLDAAGNHTLLMAYNRAAVLGPIAFTQPLLTDIASFTLQGDYRSNANDCWSQILCTEDISTIGGHVAISRANGAGAHSDWTGSYTDVNEVFTNDTTVNTASAAGLSQSYTMGNIGVPSGYLIGAVFHWLRAKNTGSSPENISTLLRTAAAVDHESGDMPGMLVTFSNVGARFNANPDTGLPWIEADWNAPVQLGFTSEA